MKVSLKSPDSVYFLIVILYLVFQLLFLTRLPDVMEDEPWYASTAYNFSQGHWFTNTNVGHQGGDYFVVYTFLLGIGIKLFGCTLLVTRMVSVVGGVLALIGLIQVLKLLKVSNRAAILTLLFFIFSNVLFVIYRTARPDGWILTFGIWAIFYFLKFHGGERNKHLILGGVFATLSFLAHPNGILFLVNGGLFILIYAIRKKSYIKLLYFGMTAILIMAAHFLISLSNPNIALSEFFDQLLGRNAISNDGSTSLESFVAFYNSYTLGIKRLYILLFEIGMICLGILMIKRNSLIGFLSLLGLMNFILSMLLFSPYSSRHFGEIFIYSFLVFPLILDSVKVKKLSYLFLSLGIIYLINSFAGDGYLIYGKYKNTPYSTIESFIEETVPENSVVVSSLHLWYPLKNSQIYSEYTRFHYRPHENLTELFNSNDVDYIIYSDVWLNGITGTSGRSESLPDAIVEFFGEVNEIIADRGNLVAELPTNGYDVIRVYEVNPQP